MVLGIVSYEKDVIPLYFFSQGARVKAVAYSPTSGTAVTLKTGRRDMPGSNPGRACQPSRSEFPVVFSETSVNMG